MTSNQRWFLVVQRGQLIGLVLIYQRTDNLVEAAFKDLVQLIEGQVDTVVCDATLWVVIGADAFRAVAGTNE